MTTGPTSSVSGAVDQNDCGGARFRIQLPWWHWLGYALALLAIAITGATSYWMEAGRTGAPVTFWPYAVDEATSVATVFALTPFLLAWSLRLDPRRIGWRLTVLGHAGGMIAFTTLHIAGMLVLRHLAYPLFGGHYQMNGEPVLTRLIYEGRKDALTYAGLVIGIWLLRAAFDKAKRAATTPPGPAAPARLEIRDGAKRTWLAANDVLWAEAAGNYVELHLAERSLLRRQTLAALERELAGHDFVRIHRSRLVNARHVSTAQSNESGDFTITLADGRRITGGRRWRHHLDQLAARQMNCRHRS